MLCTLSPTLLGTYLILSFAAILSILIFSTILFHYSYVNPTFKQWQYKINPNYPTVSMVRAEIFYMIKGALVAVTCPAISVWLAGDGNSTWSKGYCGVHHGYGYEILIFIVIWFCSDLYEFFYHYLGHTMWFFWLQHKTHHKFYNPSPYSVIADDAWDQFCRSAPLLVYPFIFPVNMDLMFFEFGLFFYGYGLYLHWGHELDFPGAHHPWINATYHHWIHHAKSVAYKAYHCGFFFKFWDYLFGSTWKKECLCSACARKNGLRTKEAWEKIEKPDYSSLLSVSEWVAFLQGSEKEPEKRIR